MTPEIFGLCERIIRLETELEWIKNNQEKFYGNFATLGLLIISGLGAIAFMVFKQKKSGE